MRAGQHTHAPLATLSLHEVEQAYPHLSESQRDAVAQILASRDQMEEGVAGAGKTTTLVAVREAAERAGCHVDGVAPTSRAAQTLEEAGIPAMTLQRSLVRQEDASEVPRLHVLDESSLASTRLMHDWLQRLGPEDRVLLVGDVRQHYAVNAGRPYQQLQEAGIETARLEAIVRQKDPTLKAVVEQLARGDVRHAIQSLDAQGRVHEIADPHARLEAIAREYLRQPDHTLVVSPDHHSRMVLNEPSTTRDRTPARSTTPSTAPGSWSLGRTSRGPTGNGRPGTSAAMSCAIPPAVGSTDSRPGRMPASWTCTPTTIASRNASSRWCPKYGANSIR